MDILNLSGAIGVKLNNLAAGRGGGSLLKVRAKAAPEVAGTLGNAVALVSSAGTVSGVVLLVKALKSGEEAVGHFVLGVKLDGALNGSVADDVAVGEVFGEDTRAGLLLLGDVVGLALSVGGVVGTTIITASARAGDGDVVGAKLRIVEEEGSLHGSLLLEGDFSGLSLAFSADLDVCDLSTVNCQLVCSLERVSEISREVAHLPEAEEVLDFTIAGGRSNVLDGNGRVGSHFVRICSDMDKGKEGY